MKPDRALEWAFVAMIATFGLLTLSAFVLLIVRVFAGGAP